MANNDDKLRLATVKKWSGTYAEYLGGNVLKKEDINYSGCQSEGDVFIGCLNYPIRKCCRDKALTTCASCIEYQKCEMLNGFYTVPAHRIAKDNLDGLRVNR
jgi:hypothetical protein